MIEILANKFAKEIIRLVRMKDKEHEIETDLSTPVKVAEVLHKMKDTKDRYFADLFNTSADLHQVIDRIVKLQKIKS